MTITLGFDVGTQGTKGIAIDADRCTIVARASRSYGLIEGLPAGAAEQHPDTWIEALGAVARELLAQVDASRVAALAISGQQHGLVALDEDDRPVRAAKLWCDTSTADEAAQLSAALGRHVPTGYTASKIAWLARHEPEDWARTRRVLLPHDWINLALTGVARMECGDASGTGFFDVAERRFDERAIAAIDSRLGACLPPLLDPHEAHAPHGRVSAAAARRFGLPEGALVAAGGGDNMLSAIGSGATREGVLVVSLGTSGTAFAHSDSAIVDPSGLVAPFCGSTGGWLPLVCVMNLTGVTEEVRASTGRTHAELTELARAVPIGCDGLLWLPYLAGERVPDLPRATGTLLGMRAGALEPGRLYRAALEGTSLNLAWGVERLLALGVGAREVRLVGGAARNALWREVLAGALQLPVAALEEPESAALGAAIQALWCRRRAEGEAVDAAEVAEPFVTAGETVHPDASEAETWSTLTARFRDQVRRLHGDVGPSSPCP